MSAMHHREDQHCTRYITFCSGSTAGSSAGGAAGASTGPAAGASAAGAPGASADAATVPGPAGSAAGASAAGTSCGVTEVALADHQVSKRSTWTELHKAHVS